MDFWLKWRLIFGDYMIERWCDDCCSLKFPVANPRKYFYFWKSCKKNVAGSKHLVEIQNMNSNVNKFCIYIITLKWKIWRNNEKYGWRVGKHFFWDQRYRNIFERISTLKALFIFCVKINPIEEGIHGNSISSASVIIQSNLKIKPNFWKRNSQVSLVTPI